MSAIDFEMHQKITCRLLNGLRNALLDERDKATTAKC